MSSDDLTDRAVTALAHEIQRTLMSAGLIFALGLLLAMWVWDFDTIREVMTANQLATGLVILPPLFALALGDALFEWLGNRRQARWVRRRARSWYLTRLNQDDRAIVNARDSKAR